MASFIRVGRGFRFALLAASALLLLHSPETIRAETRQDRAREELSGIRIPFIANAGQTDPAVAYYAPTFAGTVFVTQDGRIVYSFAGAKDPASNSPASGMRTGWSLTEILVGGRALPRGTERTSTGVRVRVMNGTLSATACIRAA